MKKQIALPIIGVLLIGVIFLLSEIFNFTTLTNINKNEVIVVDSTEYDLDSCAYYLNMAVEFTVDTLAGMEEYKKNKEEELRSCMENNIELVKQLEANKNTPNWKVKYKNIYERFIEVEKENINLTSENYKLKNTPKVEYKLFEPSFSVGNNQILHFSDSTNYDKYNKTVVSLDIPYFINYYDNKGQHINPPDSIIAEVIYFEGVNINVRQDISLQNVITEKDNELVVETNTDHPNVNIVSEETIFSIDKKRIKQLIRKIDPESKVLDVK